MLSEPILRSSIHIQRNPSRLQSLRNILQTKVNNSQNRLPRELVEDLDGVQTVEEFRWEVLLRSLKDFFPGFRVDDAGFVVRCCRVGEDLASEVARQANDGVLCASSVKRRRKERMDNEP